MTCGHDANRTDDGESYAETDQILKKSFVVKNVDQNKKTRRQWKMPPRRPQTAASKNAAPVPQPPRDYDPRADPQRSLPQRPDLFFQGSIGRAVARLSATSAHSVRQRPTSAARSAAPASSKKQEDDTDADQYSYDREEQFTHDVPMMRPSSARVTVPTPVSAVPIPQRVIPLTRSDIKRTLPRTPPHAQQSNPNTAPKEEEEAAADEPESSRFEPNPPRKSQDDWVQEAIRQATAHPPTTPQPQVAPDDEGPLASLHTAQNVVSYFSCHSRSYTPVKFVYLNAEPQPPGSRFRPYDLRVVPRGCQDPSNFFIMSATGVVNIRHGQPTEVVTLSAFMREASLFNVISRIKFFSRYLVFKSFVQWRRNIRTKLFCQVRRRVARSFFVANKAFCASLADLKKTSMELSSFPLVRYPATREGISKQLFLDMMAKQKTEATDTFHATAEGIEGKLKRVVERVTAQANVPDLATPEALQQYLVALEEEEARQRGTRINYKAMSMVTLKERTNARMRSLKAAMDNFTLLPQFIRLVDLMCAEALFANALQSLSQLCAELMRQDEAKLLFFIVAVHLEQDDSPMVAFEPNEDEMHEMHSQVLDEIVASATSVPRLVVSRLFRSHFELQPKVFSMTTNLRQDHRILHLVESINHLMQTVFQEAHTATRHFARNKRWVKYINSDWPQLRAQYDKQIESEQANKDFLASLNGTLTSEDFRDVLHQVEEALVSIKEMLLMRRGCLVITSTAVMELLQSKLREIEQEVRTRLLTVAKLRLERIASAFSTRNKTLAERPNALPKFAAFVATLNGIDAEAQRLCAAAEEIENIYLVGEANGGNEAQDTSRRELVLGGQHAQNPGTSMRDRFEDALQGAKIWCSESIKDMSKRLEVEIDAEKERIYSTAGSLQDHQLNEWTDEVDTVMEFLRNVDAEATTSEGHMKTFVEWQKLFGVQLVDLSSLEGLRQAYRDKLDLWVTIEQFKKAKEECFTQPVVSVDTATYAKRIDELYSKTYSKLVPKQDNGAAQHLLELLREEKQMMPTTVCLGNKNLKKEHWQKILAGQQRSIDTTLTLESLKQLHLYDTQYREVIAEQSAIATGEAQLMDSLEQIRTAWEKMEFAVKPHRAYRDQFILDDVSEIVQLIEEHQLVIQSCLASRYAGGIRFRVEEWERRMTMLNSVIDEWVYVQGAWMYLEFIFSSEDIKKQLPTETGLFKSVDADYKGLIRRAMEQRNCIVVGAEPTVLAMLQDARKSLDEVQKRLEDYLETKRSAFPRFYFLSNDELLSILSDVRNPRAVRPHLRKCFDSIKDLSFKNEAGTEIGGMISAEGEAVMFGTCVNARGPIEGWLLNVEKAMITTLRDFMQVTLQACRDMDRTRWTLAVQQGEGTTGYPAQCIQAVDMVEWTREVENAVQAVYTGDNAQALIEYHKAYLQQILNTVAIVRLELTPLQRSLVGTLLVVDVHNRDVVEGLVASKVTSTKDLQWNMQLRYYAGAKGAVTIQQVTATFNYSFEYLGSAKRLVITPLTDRAFLTCTQALHLHLGGAPQGPAGTGKTESVKDLGKALARQVVVFNCSDGINYSMMSQMFAGLAQGGAWACFDEFNRIELEVLSVIAQQMLEITTAIAQSRTHLVFDGRDIALHPNFGVFVTMNPGYAGRTELPDNLKVLFRPVCMMIPDYRIIAEIMFFSEGFNNASTLSLKMVQLYKLSSEQLSKQDHYDFGMRAVKSILVMAGSLKRAAPDEDEDVLLIRAMRNSNLPKFLRDDTVLFNALIRDLYPNIDIPDKVNTEIRDAVEETLKTSQLQPIPLFITKVLQLHDTMVVRHGVMLVGRTLTGKTTCMSTLQNALGSLSKKQEASCPYYVPTHQHVVNPKAVTRDELYGSANATTREWTDGILSKIVRNVCEEANTNRSTDRNWIVFDGPVDAVWIENMNTVLDDNKMLCLVNGERLKIPETVSFLFEVQDLRVASPATVSRCGMVFLESSYLAGGWKPQATCINRECASRSKAWSVPVVERLIDMLVQPTLDFLEKCSEWIHAVHCQRVTGMLGLLEALLLHIADEDDEPPEVVLPKQQFTDDGREVPRDAVVVNVEYGIERNLVHVARDDEKLFQMYAVFAFIWGVGGNLAEKANSREQFSEFVRPLIEKILPDFPKGGSVFDFCIHKASMGWVRWSYRVPQFVYRRKAPFFELLVPTAESVSANYLTSALLTSKRNVLINGLTGTGKSVGCQSVLLDTLKCEDSTSPWSYFNIVMSAQTTSNDVQEKIEAKLRKHPSKSKRLCLGPPPDKFTVMLVDDVNLPKLDTYGASPPIELLRQVFVQGGMYDRKKCLLKDIIGVCALASCGPPGGGKNEMTERFTSRFFMLCQPTVPESSMLKIFSSILQGFFSVFSEAVQATASAAAQASIDAYRTICCDMLPTPQKSHYTFNLRDVGKVVHGITQTVAAFCESKEDVARLWVHEASRVFHDRLTCEEDRLWWRRTSAQIACMRFDVPANPRWTDDIFGDFGTQTDARPYQPILIDEHLHSILNEKMNSFGIQFSCHLDLVMFDDAIRHLARVCRILRQQHGNALLVGVGGSGRHSLSRLAAFIADMARFEIAVSRTYGVHEFREDLRTMLLDTGCEAKSTAFILSDTQLVNDQFLEDVNNLLNTGEVTNLWQPEDHERIMNSVREAVVEAGKAETPNVMMAHFVTTCRDNLHIILCISPVGTQFRTRLRMFPSLVNCMTIDWYSQWPTDALQGVAVRHLHGIELEDDNLLPKLAKMCVHMHHTVEGLAEKYYSEVHRHAYTTPTSYLSLLESFTAILSDTSRVVTEATARFEGGVGRLQETNQAVDRMKAQLRDLEPILEKQSEEATRFAKQVEEEKKAASEVQQVVQQEERECSVMMAEATAIKDDCQVQLDKAMPAYHAAVEALNALNPRDINEAKAYAAPPKKVEMVMDAVLTILDEDKGWDSARHVMGRPDFINSLRNFDKDNVPERILRKLRKYVEMDDFRPEAVRSVSFACVSLCMWCRAIDNYCDVLKVVQPKRERLKVAEEKLAKSREQLDKKQQELRRVEDRIAHLKRQFDQSVEKKKKLESDKQRCQLHLERADKLLSGLSNEYARWKTSIQKYSERRRFTVGQSVLAAGLVSYGGPYTIPYRNQMTDLWRKRATDLGIPVPDDFTLRDIVDPVVVRRWGIEGLPSDEFSTQNGVIVTKSGRWCLCVDPQSQANSWIKNSYRDRGLKVLKMTDANLLRTIETCVIAGNPVLIENVGEDIDAALDPVLQRMTYHEGGRTMIRVRDQPVEYHENFFFIMTTRIPNPHYLPEIQIKINLLNFSVTTQGLEQQLLAEVVRFEKKELEERADRLVVQIADAQSQLVENEEKILALLSASSGDILDNEVLIDTLAESKKKSDEVSENLNTALHTSADIAKARDLYRPMAKRGSVVFSTLSEVATLQHMYQNSLSFFLKLFRSTLARTPRSDDVAERCKSLTEAITTNGFNSTCRGMFASDKPAFAFLLAAAIQRQEGTISDAEWNFFLRGAGGILVSNPKQLNEPHWVSEAQWEELLFVSQLPGMQGVDDAINGSPDEWKEALSNGMVPLVRGAFRKLLLMRILQEDRVAKAASDYVVETLGPNFIDPPSFDMQASFADSTCTTPIILVLAVGTDPTTMFTTFAESRGFGGKRSMLSLGQNQGAKAEALIAKAAKAGEWVYLQNCHVYTSWLRNLEQIVEKMSLNPPHEDYRLWLTTLPCNEFSVPVLQASVKVTREPPRGLRANLRETLAAAVDSVTWEMPAARVTTWQRLLFSLVLFHGVVQERRKFGPLGWNIPYDWNLGDLDASIRALRGYVDEFEVIPWNAVRYVLGTINYGGRVTDSWDLRCLTTLLERFVGPHCLDETKTVDFTGDGVYVIPTLSSLDAVVSQLGQLPQTDDSAIFGLHSNSELAFQSKASKHLIHSVVEVQPKVSAAAAGGAGEARADPVLMIAADLAQRLPAPIDRTHHHSETYQILESGTMVSLGTVCIQEIERFNALLAKLCDSLAKLQAAIKGQVVMDAELEQMHASISFFIVPKLWEDAAYPSLKPLPSWFADLSNRVEFFRDWNDMGVPSSFWLGGFFFPQGFLTGVLQTHSRSFNVPIDKLRFRTSVTSELDPLEAHLELLSSGVYVHGLTMEGARWADNHICESSPRQLHAKMPIVCLEPVAEPLTEAEKSQLYECPIYKIGSRAGTLSTTGLSTNFVLSVHLDPGHELPQHWTLRGAAILTSLDD